MEKTSDYHDLRQDQTLTDDTEQDRHPYDSLTPDVILDAVESQGYVCTGELLALNSYENRVYRVRIESGENLAAKFYRPQRWPRPSILEEHAFAQELFDAEIPLVAPLRNESGESLHHFQGFDFSLYPWQPGRAPELNEDEEFRIMGRYLGRIHAVGSTQSFRHRPRLDVDSFGREPAQYLMQSRFIPMHLETAYSTLVEQLLLKMDSVFESAAPINTIRLHGDCHLGNVLWNDGRPHIVDLDDCRSGPAVQDLWMLLSGERAEREQQLSLILEGYREFHHFNYSELALIESLRTLRLIHYSAWLAQRWDDPAFPIAFPWFDSNRYWEEQVLTLREQQAELNEPPLTGKVY